MNRTYIKTWDEYCDEHTFIFPVVVDTNFDNMNRIHPLKQGICKNILNCHDVIDNCKQIIVFGSSVSMKCDDESDIDLAIELKTDSVKNRNSVSESIGAISDWNYDIIWLDDTIQNEPIYEKIKRGVYLLNE
ncbi:MAG: hypothetical protein LBQ16_04445 [Gracilibacteraceae bacterium]|nr:hypothetical protein [Gracilibacteraceae bacterium]